MHKYKTSGQNQPFLGNDHQLAYKLEDHTRSHIDMF